MFKHPATNLRRPPTECTDSISTTYRSIFPAHIAVHTIRVYQFGGVDAPRKGDTRNEIQLLLYHLRNPEILLVFASGGVAQAQLDDSEVPQVDVPPLPDEIDNRFAQVVQDARYRFLGMTRTGGHTAGKLIQSHAADGGSRRIKFSCHFGFTGVNSLHNSIIDAHSSLVLRLIVVFSQFYVKIVIFNPTGKILNLAVEILYCKYNY